MVTPYFPQALFSAGDPAPRVFVSPQRYIQGDGVVDHIGSYLSLVNARRSAILVSKRGSQADGKRIVASMEKAGIEPIVSIFNGECSMAEAEHHVEELKGQTVDSLVAVGGGKCVDSGKSIAYRLGVPLAVVPTLASNDAPTSALAVFNAPDGVFEGAEFFPDSPAMVVVDTGIVARASERYLVSGIGDAMATWYEARACLRNPEGRSVVGGRPTLAAAAIGEICAKTLFESGIAAAKAVAEDRVDEALERVVEANTLLSGLGFESGGLAVAHGVAQSFTHLHQVHDNHLHGELVAMGTLTQLMMESVDEARELAEFFTEVGLPVHLGQLSMDAGDSDAINTVVDAAMGQGAIHNLGIPMTPDTIRTALMAAHELGLSVTKANGDAAYRRLHPDAQ